MEPRSPSRSFGLPAAAIVLLLGGGGAGTAACGGGGYGGPTGPGGSLCGRVTPVDNGISIRTDCQTTPTSGFTNEVRDQFGRPLSFNFDFMCTDGSLRLTGRVYNAQYNTVGELLAFQWTINGETCSYSRNAGTVASAAVR
ncbi:MAG: hypothetical protein ABR559_03115 [Gemmatimonadota bacterium]